MTDNNSFFVWRIETQDSGYGDAGGAGIVNSESELLLNTLCKYCGERIWYTNTTGDEMHEYVRDEWLCELCGWSEWHETFDDVAHDAYVNYSGEYVLREFDIKSPELSMEELGSFVRRRFDKINAVSPRQMELLVGDVFKNQGYEVQLTKTTRDGGYDLLLLQSKTSVAIVEVKRYKNTIGVELIRQLRGVQIREGIQQATLVTTSTFSTPARREAHAQIPKQLGFNMSLVDANELLRMLTIYRKPTYTLQEFEALRQEVRCKQEEELNK